MSDNIQYFKMAVIQPEDSQGDAEDSIEVDFSDPDDIKFFWRGISLEVQVHYDKVILAEAGEELELTED